MIAGDARFRMVLTTRGSSVGGASPLPPAPSLPPALQMANWIFRPIKFQEECRAKLGDTFSVNFPAFERPMVLISRPDHVAALYKERRHGLPRGGRSRSSRSSAPTRSCCSKGASTSPAAS